MLLLSELIIEKKMNEGRKGDTIDHQNVSGIQRLRQHCEDSK